MKLRCIPHILAASLLLLLASPLAAQSRLPDALPCELTYFDKELKKNVTLSGELVFDEIPVLIDGKPATIGKGALIPNQLNPASLTRSEDKQSFIWKSSRPDKSFTFALKSIPVKLGDAAELNNSIDAGFAPSAEDAAESDLHEKAPPKAPDPVIFALQEKKNLTQIPIDSLQSILFQKPPEVKSSFDVTGRFVSYSKRWKGSNSVQLEAATYLGSKANESFSGAAFLPDGSILALLPLTSADLLSSAKNTSTLGDANLPLPAAPQPLVDPKSLPAKSAPPDPRTALALVKYTPNLSEVTSITRLPWGSSIPSKLLTAPDGSLFVTGRILDPAAFASVLKSTRVTPLDPIDPNAPAPKKPAPPQPDSFIAKLSPDASSFTWLAHIKGRNSDLHFRAKNELLVEIAGSRRMFLLDSTGALQSDFTRQYTTESRRSNIAVSPYDNAFYLGGDYHANTAFEPYRNPYMFRFNPDGQVHWTGWNWTGALTGMSYFREVSDSAIRLIRFANNGDLLVVGWSDGGNSVLRSQPYDIEKHHGKYKAFSDMSAAAVGSFCHVLRMKPDSSEVISGTMIIPYHPFTNKPNSATIADMAELPDGRFALTGGTAYGLIETADALANPWIKQFEKDPKTARPVGGPFLMLFSPDFTNVEFSSIIPGLRNQTLATHKNKILLAGAAPETADHYGVPYNILTKNPPQKTFGGGTTDAYLILLTITPPQK